MVPFKKLHPRADVGFLPFMLSEDDPSPAKEQFHRNYAHGGGWLSFNGFALGADNSLNYPEDLPMYPIAEAQLRKELILLYPHSWVAIIQPDRSFDVCRMD